MRGLLFRFKKGNWQALTAAGLLDLLFGLLGFGQIKNRYNYVFKGAPSEKKNSQDDLPALAYFSKIFKLHIFISNLPSKKGRSNVTYPMRVSVNNGHMTGEPKYNLHMVSTILYNWLYLNTSLSCFAAN